MQSIRAVVHATAHPGTIQRRRRSRACHRRGLLCACMRLAGPCRSVGSSYTRLQVVSSSGPERRSGRSMAWTGLTSRGPRDRQLSRRAISSSARPAWAPKAITAMAHRLARLVHRLLLWGHEVRRQRADDARVQSAACDDGVADCREFCDSRSSNALRRPASEGAAPTLRCAVTSSRFVRAVPTARFST